MADTGGRIMAASDSLFEDMEVISVRTEKGDFDYPRPGPEGTR